MRSPMRVAMGLAERPCNLDRPVCRPRRRRGVVRAFPAESGRPTIQPPPRLQRHVHEPDQYRRLDQRPHLRRERQFATFVDPKGLRNISWEDPKLRFHKTINKIEERLGDPKVIPNSFIVFNTTSHTLRMQWHGKTKAEMEARHIFFLDEDAGVYIRAMLEKAVFEPA